MTYSSIFKKNSKEVRQNEPLCFFVLSFFSISIQFFSQTFSVFLNTIYNIGDDLNDWEPMQLAGVVCCPGDACDEVKKISNYVAKASGGYGAVRECITYLLKKRGEWEYAIAKAYGFGI